jgi:hypothetical protein
MKVIHYFFTARKSSVDMTRKGFCEMVSCFLRPHPNRKVSGGAVITLAPQWQVQPKPTSRSCQIRIPKIFTMKSLTALLLCTLKSPTCNGIPKGPNWFCFSEMFPFNTDICICAESNQAVGQIQDKERLFPDLYLSKKSEVNLVKVCGDLYGCEMSRIPHFIDSRLTDGGEVSLTRRPRFTTQQDSWYASIPVP